jgi:hypothetical protein
MRLRYRLATISYCPDLTDPSALSVPIAVLAVGKEDGRWSAAAVAVDAKQLGLDPLSTAMLADVPHMIRRHVDLSMAKLGADATPDEVVNIVRESLKTSIHVSELSGHLEVEVPDPRRIAEKLFEKAAAVFEAAIRRVSREILTRLPSGAWRPLVTPESLIDPAPEQLFWQPQVPSVFLPVPV